MVALRYSDEPWFRYTIYAVNALFAVFGFLLILWGALAIRGVGDFESVDESFNVATVPVWAILLGTGLIVGAVLGFVGSITQNFYVTLVYSVLVLLVTVLTVILVGWMFVQRESFISRMEDSIENTFAANDRANGYPFDVLELTFDCCGLQNSRDHSVVPKTCCGHLRSSKAECKKDVYENKPGCREAFTKFWNTNINWVRALGIVVVLLEGVILWVAVTLTLKYRNSGGSNITQ